MYLKYKIAHNSKYKLQQQNMITKFLKILMNLKTTFLTIALFLSSPESRSSPGMVPGFSDAGLITSTLSSGPIPGITLRSSENKKQIRFVSITHKTNLLI